MELPQLAIESFQCTLTAGEQPPTLACLPVNGRVGLGGSEEMNEFDLDVELRAALHDLRESVAESQEEGFTPPSIATFASAERLLCRIYQIGPRRFEIYPTPDGEIVVDAPCGFGRSMLLLCQPNGTTLCMVNMDGEHQRKRYDNLTEWPDDFVQTAVKSLTTPNESPA